MQRVRRVSGLFRSRGSGGMAARRADRIRKERDRVGDVGLFGIVWRRGEKRWEDRAGRRGAAGIGDESGGMKALGMK